MRFFNKTKNNNLSKLKEDTNKTVETYKDKIDRFTGKLKEILIYEMSLGNKISDAYIGNWPYFGNIVIMLEKPFSPPIFKNIDGIEFKNINDPHYWKAEYYDSKNNLLLCCNFGGILDFNDL